MTIKNSFLILVLIILNSCAENPELENLKKENSELNQKIKELESKDQNFTFIPYSTLDKYTVKQGEDIYHQVSLAWFNKNEKPLVLIMDPETGVYKDTLAMKNGFCSEFIIKTDKLGENKIEGKVKFKVNGIEKESFFETTYIVK